MVETKPIITMEIWTHASGLEALIASTPFATSAAVSTSPNRIVRGVESVIMIHQATNKQPRKHDEVKTTAALPSGSMYAKSTTEDGTTREMGYDCDTHVHTLA
jgi:hypothetical protein